MFLSVLNTFMWRCEFYVDFCIEISNILKVIFTGRLRKAEL